MLIPTSKFALRQQQHQHANLAPSPGEEHYEDCILLEVYDAEKISYGAVPERILTRQQQYPGRLYAWIKIVATGKKFYLSFRDTASQIFSTHGNSAILEGAEAVVVFKNNRMRKGEIVFVDDVLSYPANIALSATAWDIGMIV